jgi:site-specific DNA-methyltransferase (adenine-specific)/site-specific DNA-methyltransferase (cytosine-N4-specific)
VIKIMLGDCRALLHSLPEASVQSCITSPPYYGLRDYGTPPLVWEARSPRVLCTCGRKDFCAVWCGTDHAHEWGGLLPPKPGRGNKPGDFSTSSLTNPARQDTVERAANSGSFCECGAWLGSLGLEPTPELYIEHLPWVRVTVKDKYEPPVVTVGVRAVDQSRGDKVRKLDGKSDAWRESAASAHTTGWRPSCAHTTEPVPQTILDPFGGAGTVGLVADRLGRNAVLIDLKPDYHLMIETRIVQDAPLFVQLEAGWT